MEMQRNTLSQSSASKEWCLHASSSAAADVIWQEAPPILGKLLGDLFSAQPPDVLSWMHSTVWELHAEDSHRGSAASLLSVAQQNGHANSVSSPLQENGRSNDATAVPLMRKPGSRVSWGIGPDKYDFDQDEEPSGSRSTSNFFRASALYTDAGTSEYESRRNSASPTKSLLKKTSTRLSRASAMRGIAEDKNDDFNPGASTSVTFDFTSVASTAEEEDEGIDPRSSVNLKFDEDATEDFQEVPSEDFQEVPFQMPFDSSFKLPLTLPWRQGLLLSDVPQKLEEHAEPLEPHDAELVQMDMAGAGWPDVIDSAAGCRSYGMVTDCEVDQTSTAIKPVNGQLPRKGTDQLILFDEGPCLGSSGRGSSGSCSYGRASSGLSASMTARRRSLMSASGELGSTALCNLAKSAPWIKKFITIPTSGTASKVSLLFERGRRPSDSSLDSLDLRKVNIITCMLSPVGTARLLWDFLFIIVLLFEMWAAPFDAVFLPGDARHFSWRTVSDIATGSFFCMDITVNVLTGFISGGLVVKNFAEAFLVYWRTWFFIDIFTTLPFLVGFMPTAGEASHWGTVRRVAAGIRALRALRLLRAIRWLKCVTRHVRFRGFVCFGLQLAKWEILLVLIAHAIALSRAAIQLASETSRSSEAYEEYWLLLYWAYKGLTLGDTSDAIEIHRGFDFVFIVLRIALLLSCISFMGTFLDRSNLAQAREERSLLRYLRRRHVSIPIQMEMLQYMRQAEAMRQEQQQCDDMAENTPQHLELKIRNELWFARLSSHQLVRCLIEWRSPFGSDLVLVVRERVLLQNMVLYTFGDLSHSAYLIVHGKIRMTYAETDPEDDFTKGMWVGEKALVNPDLPRCETMTCSCWSELLIVPAVDFRKLVEQHGLTEQFDTLLSKILWQGICGRCGTLGDHFSTDCPGRKAFLASHQVKLRHVLADLSRSSIREDAVSGTLMKFLTEHGLTRLLPFLREKGLTTMEDLIEGLRSLKSIPALQLTPTEDQVLTRGYLENFQRFMQESTNTILARSGEANMHLIFISHYKVEAGTEAALMQKEFERIIQERFTSLSRNLDAPVFIDSENLNDLRHLRDHVRKSHNLILLLTSNVLTRPWVLLELVTAVNSDVQVIPVEVQRAGNDLVYPDEAFFQQVRDGKHFDSDARQLFENEGVSLEDVEHALRVVFKHISGTFSPHKAANIREAELENILRKCTVSHLTDSDGPGEPHLKPMRLNSRHSSKAFTREFPDDPSQRSPSQRSHLWNQASSTSTSGSGGDKMFGKVPTNTKSQLSTFMRHEESFRSHRK